MKLKDRERLRDWLLTQIPDRKVKIRGWKEDYYYNSTVPIELVNGHTTLESMLNDALRLGEEDET